VVGSIAATAPGLLLWLTAGLASAAEPPPAAQPPVAQPAPAPTPASLPAPTVAPSAAPVADPGSAPPFSNDPFGAAANATDLTLRIYGDTGFSARDNANQRWPVATSNPNVYAPGVWGAFFAPRLDLFGSADVGKLSFLTEIMFEANNNEIDVDLERLQIAYLFANWLRVKAGRTHLAWGYYNDTYHHGNIFELTASRPYSVNFEDSNGVILSHNVGVGFDGSFDLGNAGSFRYDVEIGNGRPQDITSVAMQYGVTNQKDVNVRLRWMPVDGLILGINGMYEVVAALPSTGAGVAGRPQTEELVGGAHVVYTEKHFLIDVEGFAMRHNPDGLASTSIYGGFAELGYQIGAFTPYLRPEYMRFPGSDVVYQYTGDSAQGLLVGSPSIYSGIQDFLDLRVGVKWVVMPQLALKLEGERLSRDKEHQEIATLKAAFGF
jgi:hypothetical protein